MFRKSGNFKDDLAASLFPWTSRHAALPRFEGVQYDIDIRLRLTIFNYRSVYQVEALVRILKEVRNENAPARKISVRIYVSEPQVLEVLKTIGMRKAGDDYMEADDNNEPNI